MEPVDVMTATVTRERLDDAPAPVVDEEPVAPGRPSPRRRAKRAVSVPMVIIFVMSVAAVTPFRSAVDGWAFLLAAMLGAGGATLVNAICRRFQLLAGETAAASVASFAAFGAVAATGLPTPHGCGVFVSGLIHGWSDLLSSSPPADLTPQLRVLPYALAWASMLIASLLLRQSNRPMLPAVGPVGGMITTLLLVPDPGSPGTAQAVAIAVGALLLGALAPSSGNVAGVHGKAHRSPRALASVMACLCFIGLAAPRLAPHLPLSGSSERFDLRRFQERPWNPLETPSPLVTLKASLKGGRSNDVVFTVRSDVAITRWSLAVLGDYNGIVWAVADERVDAPAQFTPVDSAFPQPPSDIAQQASVRYELEIGSLRGSWIPVAGWPQATDMSTPLDLRLNQATGTLATAAELQEGQRLQMHAFQRPELSDAQLMAATTVSNDPDAELTLVPPAVRNMAGDIFEGVEVGTPRASALRATFTQTGFYDISEQSRPGHSLAQIDEFLADPERLVGYAEHYAAAAGVLARIGGVPSRVVVGYVIDEERYENGVAEITSDDITAWIEVKTVEHGWVPVSVTPDRSRVPEEDAFGVTVRDVAIPNPPPPPSPSAMAEPNAQPVDEKDSSEDEDAPPDQPGPRVPVALLVGGTAAGGPILLLGAMAGLVVAAKAQRRRRRRSAASPELQVLGAWHELIDRFSEAGLKTHTGTTPGEAAAAFATEDGDPEAETSLAALAEEVDRVLFHPHPTKPSDADEAWRLADHAVERLTLRHTRWQRFCLRTDPRPLSSRRSQRSASNG